MADEKCEITITKDDVTFDSNGRAVIEDKAIVSRITELLNEKGAINLGKPSRAAETNSGCTNWYCPTSAALANPKDVFSNLRRWRRDFLKTPHKPTTTNGSAGPAGERSSLTTPQTTNNERQRWLRFLNRSLLLKGSPTREIKAKAPSV